MPAGGKKQRYRAENYQTEGAGDRASNWKENRTLSNVRSAYGFHFRSCRGKSEGKSLGIKIICYHSCASSTSKTETLRRLIHASGESAQRCLLRTNRCFRDRRLDITIRRKSFQSHRLARFVSTKNAVKIT